MKRNHQAENVSEPPPLQSDSDEEEYSEMSTQKLKKMIDEGGLSETTKGQFLTILVKKIDERDAKLKNVVTAGSSTTTTTTDATTSRLKAIREAVKNRISYGGKDEELLQDPHFKVAMESLKKNPITTIFKGATLTALWDKKRSRIGFHDPTPVTKKPNGTFTYKCQVDFCWVDEQSPNWNNCSSHCTKTVQLVRDIKADTTTVAIVTPKTQKINGFNDEDLQIFSKSKTAKERWQSLYYYMDSHKDSKTDPHVAVLQTFARLLYSTEHLLAGHGNHHNMVAMSMMVMLYNSVCNVKDRVKFINQEIHFRNGDGFQKDFFVKLRRVFEDNEFIFKITGEKKSTTVLPQSLHPTVCYDNLPSSYLARDNETGEIYSGEKWGIVSGKGDGSSSHTRAKKTGLSDFDKNQIKRIYQFPHPQADLIKDKRSYTRLSEEEKKIHDEMKKPAERVETLGHISSLLAQMLGLKINGNDIIFMSQKFVHFDDSFSKSTFDDVFGYLFGEVVEVEIPTVVKDDDGILIWKFVN